MVDDLVPVVVKKVSLPVPHVIDIKVNLGVYLIEHKGLHELGQLGLQELLLGDYIATPVGVYLSVGVFLRVKLKPSVGGIVAAVRGCRRHVPCRALGQIDIIVRVALGRHGSHAHIDPGGQLKHLALVLVKAHVADKEPSLFPIDVPLAIKRVAHIVKNGQYVIVGYGNGDVALNIPQDGI